MGLFKIAPFAFKTVFMNKIKVRLLFLNLAVINLVFFSDVKHSYSASKEQAEINLKVNAAVEKCATGISGQLISDNLIVSIVLELNPDGSIKSIPHNHVIGGTSAEQKRYAPAMIRAVKRCAPYKFLYNYKYTNWSILLLRFTPAKMFQ